MARRKSRLLMEQTLDAHTPKEIVEAWISRGNCYGDFVEAIMEHINERLETLNKIQFLTNKEEEQ